MTFNNKDPFSELKKKNNTVASIYGFKENNTVIFYYWLTKKINRHSHCSITQQSHNACKISAFTRLGRQSKWVDFIITINVCWIWYERKLNIVYEKTKKKISSYRKELSAIYLFFYCFELQLAWGLAQDSRLTVILYRTPENGTWARIWYNSRKENYRLTGRNLDQDSTCCLTQSLSDFYRTSLLLLSHFYDILL